MMRLELQFRRRRKIPWSGLAVLCGALGGALFMTDTWLNLDSSVNQLQERSAQLAVGLNEQQRVLTQSRMEASPAEELRRTEQQKIIASLQYPWNRVLAPIELDEEKHGAEKAAENMGVAILSIVHDQATQISQIKVEALTTPAIIRFVEKMNAGDTANHWYIASYQLQKLSVPVTVKATILNQ